MVEPADEGITQRRILAKRANAIDRLQQCIAALERLQRDHTGKASQLVAATTGRAVNSAIFALSDDLGGMEQIRVLMIGNDAFLPPSKRFGLPDEMVPVSSVLSSARRTLTALGVE